MKLIVPADQAVPVDRPVGSTVTFVNQGGTDVYIDSDFQRLNASIAGVAPDGTKLVNGGGQIQITNYPGRYYLRAASNTTIEVQP